MVTHSFSSRDHGETGLRRRELLQSIGAGALLATLGACAPLPRG